MIFPNSESALNALKTIYEDKQALIDYRDKYNVLRAKIESVGSPTLSSEPHGSIPPGTDGDLITWCVDVQKLLQIKTCFYHEKLNAITDILDNIQAPLYARILTYRYIKGMSWSSIANLTCYSKSHLYTLHRNALELYVNVYQADYNTKSYNYDDK